MKGGRLLIAQSGGPTAVVNATAVAAALEARRSRRIGEVWAASEGLLGLLEGRFIDLGSPSRRALKALSGAPGAAFGSCRRGLADEAEGERAVSELKRHDVRYLLYIGGNDSMRNAADIDRTARRLGYELFVLGIPKTIDNDLAGTDHCPGYGSAARMIATMVMEAGLDTEALSSFDRVNIIETMGRDAGWLAASTALARRGEEDAPHLILLPELPFDEEAFCSAVEGKLGSLGRCVIAVSEGLRLKNGDYLSAQGGAFGADQFGHAQLGGAAFRLKTLVEARLKAKTRFCISSTAQRVAGHWASGRDLEESARLGRAAVRLARSGVGGLMLTLERSSGPAYRCSVGSIALDEVAGKTRAFPAAWIDDDGLGVRSGFLDYLRPLVTARPGMRLRDGLPLYPRLERRYV